MAWIWQRLLRAQPSRGKTAAQRRAPPAQGHAPLQQRGGSGGLRGKGGFPALCDFEATLYKGKDLPGAALVRQEQPIETNPKAGQRSSTTL